MIVLDCSAAVEMVRKTPSGLAFRCLKMCIRDSDWEFLFLGANIEAIGTAASMGIQADHATSYLSDSQGTPLSYAAVSAAALQFRSCSEAGISPRWKASLEQDVQARG